MYRIFIIEDDENIRRLIKNHLKKYNFKVDEVNDFKSIEEQFETIKPDLVLLDITLPYYDGFYICRRIRKKSNVPIIIISARDTEMEQIMGMELGADDYITKPFTPERLHAKIKALIRRIYESKQDRHIAKGASQLILDEKTFTLGYKDKKADLSNNEFKLLNKLLVNQQQIVSRDELLEELWESGMFVDDNTLTVNVSRVKGKLKEVGLLDVIQTKRGVGYILNLKNIEDDYNE